MGLFLVLIFIACLLGISYLCKRNFFLEEKRIFHVPAELLYSLVSDLQKQNTWRAWDFFDPKLEHQYSQVTNAIGSTHHWQGKYLGSATSTIQALEPHKKVTELTIHFRPVRVRLVHEWVLNPTPKGTELIWTVRGKLPFYLGLFAGKIIPRTSSTFQVFMRFALENLTNQLNQPQIPFKLEIVGTELLPQVNYIYLSYRGSYANMPSAMSKGMETMRNFLSEQGIAVEGRQFSYVEDSDSSKGWIGVRICAQVDVMNLSLPKGMLQTTFGPVMAAKAELKCGYEHLALAWSIFSVHSTMLYRSKAKNFPKLQFYNQTEPILTSLFIPLDL